MKKPLLAAAALLSLYSPDALALGRGVLWYENTSYNQNMIAAHQTALTAAGATSYTETTTWPSSLSGYRVVFVVLPNASLSGAQQTDLINFQAAGGIVVLVAEAAGYYTVGVNPLNTLSAALGNSASFVSDSIDSSCQHYATRSVSTPVLTADTAGVYYAYGSRISPGSSGQALYARNGSTFVARDGHTVLVSDSAIFAASCAGISSNATFTADIYNWSCDYDEDLVQNVDCGGSDVDDTDAAVGASRTWYADADGDGYGDPAATVSAVAQPVGYVADATDCDDNDASVNPGAQEVCDALDTDEDCDGAADDSDPSATGQDDWYADSDGDGYGDLATSLLFCEAPVGYVADATDCDDSRALSNPGVAEYCNTFDDDCDGSTDEDSALDASAWYADADSDSYGDPAVVWAACAQPVGYVGDATDCDDTNATSFPGATEYCNGADDDCDGSADEDTAADAAIWYRDGDSDTYGDPAASFVSCAAPVGYVADATDCDDSRALSNPGAAEYCNTFDDDCDGQTDEDSALDASTWYRDSDSDGYGDATADVPACVQPSGYVADATDCDDGDGSAYPGAAEYCDGVDDDCDGQIDEDGAADAATWYADADADGYGDPSAPYLACAQPSGYVSDATDCDSANAAINPGAIEVCNGADDDCDGLTDDADSSITGQPAWYLDSDADGAGDSGAMASACAQPVGYAPASGDCDDGDPTVSPLLPEVCDGADVDEDCDGLADDADPGVDPAGFSPWYADGDGDGYGDSLLTEGCDGPDGAVAEAGDCDDGDDAFFPGAPEACDDPNDYSCDGSVGYADADGDGFAACVECDDSVGAVNPGATEVCDGVDNDCDGTADVGASDAQTYYLDADGDGSGDPDAEVTGCAPPEGAVADATDCDDGDATAYVGAEDTPGDGIDQDCDGADAEALDSGDTGDSGAPGDSDSGGKDDPACGCASGSAGGGALLLSMVGLLVRRRGR